MIIRKSTVDTIIALYKEYENSIPQKNKKGGLDTLDKYSDIWDNPRYNKLVNYLGKLNENELCELIAIMWLGSEDYTGKEFEVLKQQAKDIYENGRVIDYILAQENLVKYLINGMKKIKIV
jgi:hypothetical protein